MHTNVEYGFSLKKHNLRERYLTTQHKDIAAILRHRSFKYKAMHSEPHFHLRMRPSLSAFKLSKTLDKLLTS